MVGWSTITIECESYDHAGEIQEKIEMDEEIEDYYRGAEIVKALEGGYENNLLSKAKRWINEGEMFVYVEANNTTDSGDAYVYKKSRGKCVLIDDFEGGEWQYGNDAREYISKQYDLDIMIE